MIGLSLSLWGSAIYGGSSGPPAPLTAIRASSAGFGQIGELSPATALQQTTRCVTPPFLEPFVEFSLTYALFRVRTSSFTGTVSNGAGGAGNILDVTAVSTGGPYAESNIGGGGLASGTIIVSQESGAKGGIGLYTISGSAVNIASTTFTGGDADELFKNSGALQTWEVGVAPYTPGYTSLPARTQQLISSSPSFAYDYAAWDKNVAYFDTDFAERPDGLSSAPLEIWTRVTLPSSLAGMPVNKSANQTFADRGWGNVAVTTGSSPDPITATSITAVTSTPGATAQCITPAYIRMKTAGGKVTVIALGDSRLSSTGLGVNEPAGYGDSMGDVYGLTNACERGLYYTAQLHSVMLSKPSDRVNYNSRLNANHLRRSLAAHAGDNGPDDKVLIPQLGQNDQNTANGTFTAYSSGMAVYVGMVIESTARIYAVTVRGNGVGGTSAPTGTTLGVDIAFGAGGCMIQYMGTGATANERQALLMAGRCMLMNRNLAAAMPGVPIVQELLGPYTTGTPWATAAGQADGLGSGVGINYATFVAANPALTGATRAIKMTSMSGSRTVNGGADDGTRTWKTDVSGAINYYTTPDGIHNGNYGAELGKADWTKLAVTGSP